MMLRILAAVLIVMAGAGLGFAMADRFKMRPQQLRQLQFALTVLGSEIRFRQTPLPIGLKAVAAVTPAPISAFFAELAANLSNSDGKGLDWAWQQMRPNSALALNPEDYSVLENLVQVLGAGTVFEQERQLELHQEQLRQLEREAERSRAVNEKIWRYLGVFSGLALALILL